VPIRAPSSGGTWGGRGGEGWNLCGRPVGTWDWRASSCSWRPGSVRPPAAQPADCRTFAATGQTVCGAFLAYWLSHGELDQQGYRISAPFDEVSAIDGARVIGCSTSSGRCWSCTRRIVAPTTYWGVLLGVWPTRRATRPGHRASGLTRRRTRFVSPRRAGTWAAPSWPTGARTAASSSKAFPSRGVHRGERARRRALHRAVTSSGRCSRGTRRIPRPTACCWPNWAPPRSSGATRTGRRPRRRRRPPSCAPRPLHLPVLAPGAACPQAPAPRSRARPRARHRRRPALRRWPANRRPRRLDLTGRGRRALATGEGPVGRSARHPRPRAGPRARLDAPIPALRPRSRPGARPAARHGRARRRIARGSAWITWPSSLRLRGPGCYALQADGGGFSEFWPFRQPPADRSRAGAPSSPVGHRNDRPSFSRCPAPPRPSRRIDPDRRSPAPSTAGAAGVGGPVVKARRQQQAHHHPDRVLQRRQRRPRPNPQPRPADRHVPPAPAPPATSPPEPRRARRARSGPRSGTAGSH